MSISDMDAISRIHGPTERHERPIETNHTSTDTAMTAWTVEIYSSANLIESDASANPIMSYVQNLVMG